MKPGVPEAIEAMFALCQAIGDDVSVNDLAEGCKLAIADGHDMAQIQLFMMSEAIRISKPKDVLVKEEAEI